MDDVRACRRCKKLYTYFNSELCNDCQDELEEIFRRIRDYLYDYPNHNLMEIAKETEIKESDIMILLKQGRISFTNAEGSSLTCENCGRIITTGRLCDDCKISVGKAMGDMLSRDAQRAAPRQKDLKSIKQGVTHLDDVIKR